MNIKPLCGPIAASLPQFFMMPDAGAGGGGTGAGADAGAALLDPPAGGDGSGTDLITYTPPSLDDMDFGNGENGKPPVIEGGDATGKAKGAPEPKEKPPVAGDGKDKADEELGEDAPVDKLREAYLKSKTDLAEMKKRVDAGDPRLGVLEKERDDLKKQFEDMKRADEERRAKDYENDPEVLKPITEMDSAYDEEAEAFYATMDNLDHSTVKRLLPVWNSVKKGTDGWEERQAKFTASLNAALGHEGEGKHEDFNRALQWIVKSTAFANKRNAMMDTIKKTAGERYHESSTKSFTTRKGELDKAITDALAVPEGMEKTDPTHPRVVLAGLFKALKPETVAAIEKDIPDFVRMALLGLPPRRDVDYPGMSAEQIASSKQGEARAIAAAKAHLPNVIVNGMRALRVMGPLMKELQRLRAKVGEKIEADPPDPGGDSRDKGASDQNGDGSLKDFKPPSLKHIDF